MMPFGFSGGSQERLMVLAEAPIRWTVGTAEGAMWVENERNPILMKTEFLFFFHI